MNILLVYETYSSGTQTAAELAAEILSSKNHIVKVQRGSTTKPEELDLYEAIIFASPSWWVDEKDGQPHIFMKEFFARCEGKNLNGKPVAVFGLGDVTYAHFCGAVGEMEKFVLDHQGKLITESLRIDSFLFERQKNDELLKQWLEKVHQSL